uniref:Uncharacterized protein n=1 Tax=Panstrongylus lignarius TaxID=156445 RepID=A0A224Y513_9HEMI
MTWWRYVYSWSRVMMVMCHLVMMMEMILSVLMVVIGTQFEQVCQCRKQEQQHFEQDLLGRGHSHHHGQ